MKKMLKKDLVNATEEMLHVAVTALENLHIIHKATALEELLNTKIPGLGITTAKLIENFYKIIKPVMAIARKRYKHLFEVLDWAVLIAAKLLAK